MTTSPLLKPHISESEASAMVLDSYVMHIKGTHCRNCSSGAEWSELYEVWTHPTKTGRTKLHVLRPTSTLQLLPISYHHIPSESVPICSECIETFTLENLPKPIAALDRSAWADTLQRKALSEQADRKAAAATKKPEPSLDQL